MDEFTKHLPASDLRGTGDARASSGRISPEHEAWAWPIAHQWPIFPRVAGYSMWKKGDHWRRDDARDFGIELVTSGNASFLQDGREYLVNPGQAFLLRMGSSHVYATGPVGFLRKRYVTFIGAGVEAMLSSAGIEGIDVVNVASPAHVARTIKSLQRIMEIKPADFEKSLSTLGYDLLAEIIASAHQRQSSLVQKTVDFIHRNLHRPLTNAEIACNAGIGESFCIHQFSKELNTTPLQYHLHCRLQRAVHLLRSTHTSVKEIARQVGFEDPLYFSKVFRKTQGKSPRLFRRTG